MHIKTLTPVIALLAATPALADGITHLSLGATVLNGEIDRPGLEGDFDDQRNLSGEFVYQLGAITAYGSLVLDRADFNANSRANGVNDERLFELGGEYSFGEFALGANMTRNDFDTSDPSSNFTDNQITTATVYGQYQRDGLIAGLGFFNFDLTSTGPGRRSDFDETNPIIFASYEMDNGLLVGGGAFEINSNTYSYLFGDYEAGLIDVTFDFVDNDDETYTSLSGGYDLNPKFAIIGGISNTNTKGGDGTTQTFLGGRYLVAEGVSAEIAYHKIDAFNQFDGDAISFGLTYEIGRRKGGIQSVGKTLSTGLASPFFTY
ncbi:hypothetical protein [Roseobacter fucihabitans]|nr:hypothetical protein [Roseobacter litoralis]